MRPTEYEIKQDDMRLLNEQTAMIVHEIRSPIQALKAQLTAMERQLHQKGVSEQDARIRMMQNALNGMNSLLSQLLVLGRMPEEELTALSLPVMAEETLQLLRGLCIKAGVTAEAEAAEMPHVTGNEQGVRRILLNLVVNAVQAMEEETGHSIRITFARRDGMQTVTVANDGPMITAVPPEKVFEAYFTTKADGNGLGLYGCRQLADSMGGSLTVETAPERTAFLLTLPEEAV